MPEQTGDGAAAMLVLGGARSGKSAFAQRYVETTAAARGARPVFVATAQAHDLEMAARIADHVAARDARWRTVEAPYDLAAVVAESATPQRVLLVDCLTLWLSNLLVRGDDLDQVTDGLVGRVERLRTPVVFVSNEVGSGIVPDNALARRFRDAQGRLNQRIAAVCPAVVLVTAGIPLALKGSLPPM